MVDGADDADEKVAAVQCMMSSRSRPMSHGETGEVAAEVKPNSALQVIAIDEAIY